MAFHVACPFTLQAVCRCLAGGKAPFPVSQLQQMFANPQEFVRESSTVDILVPRLNRHGAGRLRPLDFFEETRKQRGGLPGRRENPLEGQTGSGSIPNKFFAGIIRKQAEEKTQLTRSGRIPDEAAEGRQPLKSEKGGGIGEPDASLVKQGGGKCEWCQEEKREGTKEEGVIECRKCSKEFHVECIKQGWAKYRDHFDWNNLVCPYCRRCTGCGQPGSAEELERLIVCKRCDIMYHQRCVGLLRRTGGPFLCADHVQCRSCGTRVPGTGISGRWYLGHLLCDACGRLWLKDKFCPVCYKVYRNSETGLLGCSTCGHSVHVACDPKPEARARAHYACPACRGEVPRLSGSEIEVMEYLWRLKDADDEGVLEVEGPDKEKSESGVQNEEDEKGEEGLKEVPENQGREEETADEMEEGSKEREDRELEDGAGDDLEKEVSEKAEPEEKAKRKRAIEVNVERVEADQEAGTPEKIVEKEPDDEKLTPDKVAGEPQEGAEDVTPVADSSQRDTRRKRTPSSKFKDMQVTLKRKPRPVLEEKVEAKADLRSPREAGENEVETLDKAEAEEVKLDEAEGKTEEENRPKKKKRRIKRW